MKHLKKIAPSMAFIILIGLVSMFSDMTHEGAESINGAYMALLGASPAVIGFISGLGELVGYSMRFIFGKLTDKTKKYWPMTIAGYIIDIIAIPLLALGSENGWIYVCVMLIVQRMGKAIRKPAKSTIVSFAASQMGVGKGFAIQEALDQLGAFLGPVLLYVVMLFKNGQTLSSYAVCYAVLGIPAIFTLLFLILSRTKFPHPESFEPEQQSKQAMKIKPSFVIYLAAISLFAFGFADFALITMHVSSNQLLTAAQIPLLYAAAMFIDALSALLFGWLFDKFGYTILCISAAVSAPFALFVFGFSTLPTMVIGVFLWGIGMGAQESIMKASVSVMVPKQSRASGYGMFELFFGVAWFLGSWLIGVLYGISIPAMIAVSVAAQVAAIPLYIISGKKQNSEARRQSKNA